jgi:hypothetical protein
MSHLTPEQIEQWVQEPQGAPDHARECLSCRQRLDEALEIRRRLRRAYATIHADEALGRQVAASLRAAEDDRPAAAGSTTRAAALPLAAANRSRLLARWLPPSLAAAAILIAAVALSLYVAGPQPAQAAPAELAQIHQANLMPHADLHGSADPNQVADYLRKELGFVPAMPQLGAGRELRGCCVAYFRNRPVGSYVMETGRGIISIIVLRDKAGSLSLGDQTRRQDRTYHTGAFARNCLAAVEIDGFTYCAVGQTDAPWLIDLLLSLLPEGTYQGRNSAPKATSPP